MIASDLIGSPGEGDIVAGPTVTVTGTIPADLATGGVLKVNGITTAVAPDRTWSVAVPQATPAT